MASRAWRNFVNASLTEIEELGKQDSDKDTDSQDARPNSDPESPRDATKSWCDSIDRSFGYAFKSFCRFVITKTLSECSVRKTSEIGPDHFRAVIDRNFCFVEATPLPSIPNYYASYGRYARWHNWRVRAQRLSRAHRGCNLSYFRLLASRRRRPRRRPRRVHVDQGRYQVLAPVNDFVRPTLAMVFE